MATLTYQQTKIGGTALVFTAASAGGDKVAVSDRGLVLVNNGSAAAVTVTVVTPNLTKYGLPDPDITVSVAAGSIAAVGPFPADLAGPGDGLVSVTCSAVTSVTVAPVLV